MRKTLILVLALSLLVVTLAGCAVRTEAEGGAAPAAEAGSSIQPAIAGGNASISTGGAVRWEYDIVSFNMGIDHLEAHNERIDTMVDYFNSRGRDGWEIVSATAVTQVGDGHGGASVVRQYVFLRRPLP